MPKIASNHPYRVDKLFIRDVMMKWMKILSFLGMIGGENLEWIERKMRENTRDG